MVQLSRQKDSENLYDSGMNNGTEVVFSHRSDGRLMLHSECGGGCGEKQAYQEPFSTHLGGTLLGLPSDLTDSGKCLTFPEAHLSSPQLYTRGLRKDDQKPSTL